MTNETLARALACIGKTTSSGGGSATADGPQQKIMHQTKSIIRRSANAANATGHSSSYHTRIRAIPKSLQEVQYCRLIHSQFPGQNERMSQPKCTIQASRSEWKQCGPTPFSVWRVKDGRKYVEETSKNEILLWGHSSFEERVYCTQCCSAVLWCSVQNDGEEDAEEEPANCDINLQPL